MLTHPRKVPKCDDASEYESLETARIGKDGWGSWGFAYNGTDGCGSDGFRQIQGHSVSCSPSWACPAGGPKPLSLPAIIEDASKSDITFVSCWINDSKEFITDDVCYNGTNINRNDTTAISIDSLRRIIRGIHARNSNVWIVILGLYPDEGLKHTVNEDTLPT